jgi:hypothetical protein
MPCLKLSLESDAPIGVHHSVRQEHAQVRAAGGGQMRRAEVRAEV